MNVAEMRVLPPPELMARVAGTDSADWFVQSGAMSIRDIRAALASAGLAVFIVGLLALVVVVLVAMAYWFAPALVVLNGERPTVALQKSFAASLANIGAFLLYGLIYIGLAIVASIPMGLGWLVLGPMVVGSCYAGWRTIFGR